MHIVKTTCLLIIMVMAAADTAAAAQSEHESMRSQARHAYQDGNWNDAYRLFRQLSLDAANDPRRIAEDFNQAWQCLRNLDRINELDMFREKVIAAHNDNWRLLWAAADSYQNNNHWGYMVAGEFQRGSHRGGGRYVNAVQRDRIRALQLLNRALALTSEEPAASDVARFYLAFGRTIRRYNGYNQAWRLQYLSDLTRLPDYEPGYGYGRGTQGAPVDREGNPVFHHVPDTFDSAASDGERWRWLLSRAAATDPDLAMQVKHILATFYLSQFGVQTLSAYGHFFAGGALAADADALDEKLSPYAVHTLDDSETLARLATGVKRFSLPDEFNYIKLFRQILHSPDTGWADDAALNLAQVYQNRRLYDRALEFWQHFTRYNRSHARRQMDQILGNWGVFEPVGQQVSGRIPTVEYRFRNSSRVNFKAYRIRVATLLKDVTAYIRSRPHRLDRRKMEINNIGWRLVHDNQTKYLGRKTAEWDLELTPDSRHWDRRVTVKVPEALSRAGAYLLVAKMHNGNTARIIIWVGNTTIIKKTLNKRVWYYLADALTGQPLIDTPVDFFGYRSERIRNTKRYRIHHRSFSRRTDKNGQIVIGQDQMEPNNHWLASVNTGDRLAYLGFAGVWYQDYYDREYNQTKTFVMTDRPVYRPAQKVRFKLWMRHAQYDKTDTSTYAGRKFTLTVTNPKNEQIFTRTLPADAYGGLEGEFDIPTDAPLGLYRITHGYGGAYGGNTFRVEEYKKPEFEVTVTAPTTPVKLGEKIQAVVKAAYYFGSPVTRATVRYKVFRTREDDRWYPAFYWDWFYGPGYWWYGYDYSWYPGWDRWGCKRPVWNWWPRHSNNQPEVVADGEVNIGADGSVRIEIDTALAGLIHPDTDHRYSITAEVRDQSRRTIVGQGDVLVARQPFKVYAWTDRGHYRVGDTVRAGFKAQTLAKQPVQGRGILALYRIDYRDDQPQETEAARWDLNTDSEGRADLKFQATRAGQYRLSYRLTDQKRHAVEGGYIFTVRGEGDDGAGYRFAKIELIPDRPDYAPGDRMRLMINADYPGATVVLFVRPANGVYLPPKIIRLAGKSVVEEIRIDAKDMPNFFIEAVTVYEGRVHSETRKIIVPPEKRVLNVDVEPTKKDYRPGEKAGFKIKLTDYSGQPFQGTAVMTVYDRALEYISAGSNVPEIRSFFWKWRRQHHARTQSNLTRWFYNLVKQTEIAMGNIGVFGHIMSQDVEGIAAVDDAEIAKEESPQSILAPAPSALKDGGGAAAMKRVKSRGRRPMDAKLHEQDQVPDPGTGPDLVKPRIRTQFADTAYWAATIETNAAGMAQVDFAMPENLTGWKVMVWSMGHGTRVGQGTAAVVTRKDLIVRLQAPRFFVETDEVVLSANVHNYLEKEKTARVRLEFEGGCLALAKGDRSDKPAVIAPNGEMRVDWRVTAVKEGQAVIRMLALTDEASDAVQIQFPVYVHGMTKQVPRSGVIRPEASEAALSFQVPAERRVDQSRLELRYSPTLAGAMVDALPYLAAYPYGCTEQTLNRFLPTVITRRILLDMGLDLQAIKAKRANLNPQEIGSDRIRSDQWRRYDHNPVFDEQTVADMVAAGIQRLADMQLSDGGWGWFSGYGEKSYPHTTAYVVHGLQIARDSKAAVPPGMLARGLKWLENYQTEQIKRLDRWEEHKKNGKSRADNLDAFVYMVLADEGRDHRPMRSYLYRDRTHLAVYALAMFGLALYKLEDSASLEMILRNIEQYLVEDDENQTAYLKLPNSAYWWYWYGSEFEAHGYYLKLLSRTAPTSRKASRLVKYLLNNRRHATYWNSTRDTAVIVEALAEYLTASGEDRPDLTLEIYYDGRKTKTVAIDAENLFTFDNKFVLEGSDITTGDHRLILQKSGRGPLYFNAYLDYFTLEDFITREGLEIRVDRRVYRLKPVDKTIKDVGSRGQVTDRRVEKYERVPLENWSVVASGDLVEVELEIESKNDYEYLVFEDPKAAGFETVDVRSGYGGNEMGAYVEYRDRKVCFFVNRLARGRHSLSYRLRAEIPGRFSALPTRAYAMYAPELKANSDEIKLIIEDKDPEL